MPIVTAGRRDIEDLLSKSGILSGKQPHTPFLVFVELEEGHVVVEIIDDATKLTAYPDDTKLMVQWQGSWSSDFFQLTVGDVRAVMAKKIFGYDTAMLLAATEVKLSIGPRGGWRNLSFRCPDSFSGIGASGENRPMVEALIKFFEANNIPVRREIS